MEARAIQRHPGREAVLNLHVLRLNTADPVRVAPRRAGFILSPHIHKSFRKPPVLVTTHAQAVEQQIDAVNG